MNYLLAELRSAIVLALATTVLSLPVNAAQGEVLDAFSQKPIPYATVTLDGIPKSADADGRFFSAGKVGYIAARAPGYQRYPAHAMHDDFVVMQLTPLHVRAVYLSAFGVTSATVRNKVRALQQSNGINALVIDTKDDRGHTPYESTARASIGATVHQNQSGPTTTNFSQILHALRQEGFYLIARIVVFKDQPLARAHPEWQVRDAHGRTWQDREHLEWVDPFAKGVWRHNVDLAEEAARLGFDEVQFDYVRFPDAPNLVFSQANTRANRVEAITGFLKTARVRLAPYNIFTSADIFGYACWHDSDIGIGQQLVALTTAVDYVSPMLYPSAFTWGLPKCRNPTADPGQIVRRSLAEARRRTGLAGVRFRPWLQAFRDYAFDRRIFGIEAIRAQTDAADTQGSSGWMLWNARNYYDPEQLADWR